MRRTSSIPNWRVDVAQMLIPVVIWKNGWDPDVVMELLSSGSGYEEQQQIVNLLLQLDRLGKEMAQTGNNAKVLAYLRSQPAECRPYLRDAIVVYAEHAHES